MGCGTVGVGAAAGEVGGSAHGIGGASCGATFGLGGAAHGDGEAARGDGEAARGVDGAARATDVPPRGACVFVWMHDSFSAHGHSSFLVKLLVFDYALLVELSVQPMQRGLTLYQLAWDLCGRNLALI